MRLDPRVRGSLYALTAVLLVTGGAWWILDWLGALAVSSTWRQTGAYLLMVHGGAAMLSLMLLGALVPLHVYAAWASGSSRRTGALMLAFNAVLIATAFGLYYIGHEGLRRWTGTLHAFIGFGLPVLLAAHVLVGRRRRVDQPAAFLPRHERTARAPSSRRETERRLAGSRRRPRH